MPADFTSIQAAVDSAKAGDTVKVAAGAYFESVVMKARVDIKGSGNTITTIISNGEKNTVTGADNATISRFLITNSLSDGVGFLSNDTSPTITNCRISGCTKAGIVCNKGSLTILNNMIFDNYDGIVTGAGEAIIKNNIIYSNYDSGIVIGTGNGAITVENNTISHNGYNGIYASESAAVVVNNIISFNFYGYYQSNSGLSVLSFNDVFGNSLNYRNISPGLGDISENPLFVDAKKYNFHLKKGSPAIDAGSPAILDPDGSRSDMGAFGGPGADIPTSDSVKNHQMWSSRLGGGFTGEFILVMVWSLII